MMIPLQSFSFLPIKSATSSLQAVILSVNSVRVGLVPQVLRMGDEIVISGVSGKFPKASNVQEFSDKLFEKVYLMSESVDRYKCAFADFPKHTGLIDNVDKFDSKIHQASNMQIKICDPQTRLLTEIACEAMFDSGYSPEEFKNSNTGVYVGCTHYDSMLYWQCQDSVTGMTGVMNSPYAIPNKISYVLDLKGPSMLIDTACSSSFYALYLAYDDIKSGKCDAAIVAGSNLILGAIGSDQGVK